ncbi:hypothetical protein MOP89_08855 [Enterococcus gallinarum]|nr:hypothetical protein [Enterococcus gallinarum]
MKWSPTFFPTTALISLLRCLSKKQDFEPLLLGLCPEEPSDLAVFAEMLNTPRDIALESYYIELLGGHQSIHEEKDFYLLGLLIDEATISYEKDRLIITLFRKKY